MKIVMTDKGTVLARHATGEKITAAQYGGDVLIGVIDPGLWSQDARGNDHLSGSALDIARDLAKQMIAERIDTRMAEAGELYPAAELATQPVKLAEAQAVLAGGEAGPYLSAAAKARGDNVKSLAGKVVRKAEDEAKAVAQAEAERAAAYMAIEKAKTVKAVIEAL